MSCDVTAAIERLRAYERGFSRVNVSHDQAQRYDDIRAVLEHLAFSEAAGDTLRATVAEMRRHLPGDWQSREVFEGEREVGTLRADLAAAQARITAAGIEVERLRAEREALHSDGRIQLAVNEVLWNASNYPPAVQSRFLGQDTSPLSRKVTDAVLSVLAGGVGVSGA